MYTDELGVQFSDDRKTLIKCPEEFKGEYIIPGGTLEIAEHAFSGCSELTSVVVPEGITELPFYAFHDCTALKSVRLPNSLTAIYSSFPGCENLSSLNIPDELNEIDDYTFLDTPLFRETTEYKQLLEMRYPDDQDYLDHAESYNGDPEIVGVVRYANHGKILVSVSKDYAGEFVIPDGVETIASGAFSMCLNLTSVKVPSSVQTIEMAAFTTCTSLKHIELPDTISRIESGTFTACAALEDIKIPNSLKYIGDCAFMGCRSLQNVVLPKLVTSIGARAFYACFGLKSIILPGGIQHVGQDVFSLCLNLREIIIPKDTKWYLEQPLMEYRDLLIEKTMDTEKNVYFKHGQYLFGYDYFSDTQCDKENIISVDKYKYAPLSDVSEPGLVFVERDGKQGVLTFDTGGQGGYGSMIHSSNIFPFLYDEMLLNGNFRGEDIGYIAVRINHNWGILRVEDHMLDKHLRARRPCMMIIPCMYPTKEQAISKITPSKQYHPEFGWQDPFSEDSQF